MDLTIENLDSRMHIGSAFEQPSTFSASHLDRVLPIRPVSGHENADEQQIAGERSEPFPLVNERAETDKTDDDEECSAAQPVARVEVQAQRCSQPHESNHVQRRQYADGKTEAAGRQQAPGRPLRSCALRVRQVDVETHAVPHGRNAAGSEVRSTRNPASSIMHTY